MVAGMVGTVNSGATFTVDDTVVMDSVKVDGYYAPVINIIGIPSINVYNYLYSLDCMKILSTFEDKIILLWAK